MCMMPEPGVSTLGRKRRNGKLHSLHVVYLSTALTLLYPGEIEVLTRCDRYICDAFVISSYRQQRGRCVYLSGEPNTGKSTLIRYFRAAACTLGSTVRIPSDTFQFGLSHIHKVHLLWEGEAMESPLLKRIPHSELMPILEGECHNRLVPMKGKKAKKVI